MQAIVSTRKYGRPPSDAVPKELLQEQKLAFQNVKKIISKKGHIVVNLLFIVDVSNKLNVI